MADRVSYATTCLGIGRRLKDDNVQLRPSEPEKEPQKLGSLRLFSLGASIDWMAERRSKLDGPRNHSSCSRYGGRSRSGHWNKEKGCQAPTSGRATGSSGEGGDGGARSTY
jgi:hypothetical protein